MLVLAFLAMFGPFTIDTVFPGFEHIGTEFGVGTTELQQITSVYLVSFAVMSLLHGPISDAVGRKPVIIVGTLAYAAASIGCALAGDLGVLLIFRALQGFAAGSGQIISRAMIRDMYEGPAAQKMMAQVMMIFSVAPAIAPIIGGWLLRLGHWQIIFWFLAAFGVAMCLSTAAVLPETHPRSERRPLRIAPLIGGLVEVARSGRFLRLALASSFTFAGQFLYIAAAPIFVVSLLGKGDQDFWIFFVPMIAGMMVGAFLNSRLSGIVAASRLTAVGIVIAVSAGILNVSLSLLPGAPMLPWAVVGPSLLALGAALCFPILQLEMLDLFPHQRGSAASMQSFIQLLLNAALAGVVAPLVTGTVLQLAAASLGFLVTGSALWLWHRRGLRHNG
ncbi:MAG TPA: multidrug effflux MFS transporter [Candidatus Avipropionibacterium avicola]|uniref:Multidrug effflux MFS transporter n=1 Tax=Candidatus Avipropionibacterium avicola TaxID=2840701 RepID=A0A9D1H0C4_9ACTN|nr:multidrug effflux MFS transporter [Candidatus Avipropionibacterium avicola]